MDQYIGKLLDNRYEILELIGTGGMARVYKARCHRLNRLVAIKILREDLVQDAELRRRFHDESQAVAMLSHPNIVAVYDVSRSSDFEYIVMELIDGITLKQYMQKKGDKLSWREALHFITQIVKALGHAHSRGIIHRDIKPHNIMVLRDGSVKVADFGIARVASGGHSTLTQEALGSVHYISPEQARGSHIDARSDLYSAGVVLYEMITGRLPFEGDTPVSVAIQHINSIPLSPRELDPSIPEALETITMKAMAPNPDNRYSCADEMLADLEEFRKNPNINFDYNISDFQVDEEDEDGKTQIRQVMAPQRPVSREGEQRRRTGPKKAQRDSRREEEREGGSSTMPILVSVLVILLFVGGVFYFLYTNVLADFFQPPETYVVPAVTGKLYDDVVKDTQLLENGKFEIVLGETVEDEAPEGTILAQSPDANSTVGSASTQITVTVSAGPKTIPMINVKGMEYKKAVLALEALGLEVPTPTYDYSTEVPENYVISYTPLEGVILSPGDEVKLVVSLGPESQKMPLLSLIGLKQEEALNKIDMMNMKQGTITPQYSDDVPEGVVIDQFPAATTEVEPGTTINLIVSQGKNPAAQEKTKEVTVNVPGDGETVSVRVLMDGVEVYRGEVDTAMDSGITFSVTGSGKRVLAIYCDGVQTGTQTVDFDS